MARYETVTVIGAGVMGHALAAVHAIGGCRVILTDISEEKLNWAKSRIDDVLQDLDSYGLLGNDTPDAIRARLDYQTSLHEAVAKTDLIVEAIIESPDAKKELFEQISLNAPPETILASNTSFLDVFPLMPPQLRERALIVHWYTPPYLIDLVDVVPSPEADINLAEDMVDFLRGIGKKPILLKKFVSGYVANNIQMAIESEIFRLLDDGVADIPDIDDAIRYGLAQRLSLMGQFKKIDYTGLQVVHDSHAAGLYTPPVKPTASPKLRECLDKGKTGVLAGAGFYHYSRRPEEQLKDRDKKLAALKAVLSGFDDTL